MSRRGRSRRRFLKDVAIVSGAAVVGVRPTPSVAKQAKGRLHLACNQYPWVTYYRREGRNFNESLDSGLAEVAASGIDGFEPLITGPEQVDQLAPLLKKHALEMRSLYVNSLLHEADRVETSIDEVVAIAEKAKQTGTRIIVTNPSPIRWGGPENKDDGQLKLQAAALGELGRRLRSMGLALAYHNHDIELRHAAREFHHMMLGTAPKDVTLCLDAHWIYRGSGDSTVALFDVVELYGSRITELHLRQSADGTWTETFGKGDINYPALARQLLGMGVKPHLVLEQAVEAGTPKTMDPGEAHRQSARYAREVFAAFAG